MNIDEILTILAFANKKYLLRCKLEKPSIDSRIYIVGQVRTDTPGVTLGEREPYLREKTVGTFIEELTTFGERFHGKDFLIQCAHDVNDVSYELRYFKLTNIEAAAGEFVLTSSLEELQEFREVHFEPEFE